MNYQPLRSKYLAAMTTVLKFKWVKGISEEDLPLAHATLL